MLPGKDVHGTINSVTLRREICIKREEYIGVQLKAKLSVSVLALQPNV